MGSLHISDQMYSDVPGLPKSWDELMDCISKGEEEFERGESILWETATQIMKEHIKNNLC